MTAEMIPEKQTQWLSGAKWIGTVRCERCYPDCTELGHGNVRLLALSHLINSLEHCWLDPTRNKSFRPAGHI